jgi:hypothetical protein
MQTTEIESGFSELDLARLGAQCRTGQDVVFILGLDGTRWCVHATCFTAAWSGAPDPGYVQITLGTGAFAGRTYAFQWNKRELHSGYVGSKLGIQRERDANDLTRILAAFLGREPIYVGKFADLTPRAEWDGDRVVVRE